MKKQDKLGQWAMSSCVILSLLAPGQNLAQPEQEKSLVQLVIESAEEEPNERIVNADRLATIDERPWQVALVAASVRSDFKAQFCAGSVIAPEWILTAAHCVGRGATKEQFRVLAGTDFLGGRGDSENQGVRIPVNDIVIHKKWNSADVVRHDYDIALIKIDAQLQGRSVPLYGGELLTSGPLLVTGWGWIENAGPKSQKLQAGEPPIQSRATCTQLESYGSGEITDRMLCAGHLGGGADACGFDSGGPATVDSNGEIQLAGIVSWGARLQCGEPKKYGVYTRVSRFVGWVEEKIGSR